MSAPITPDPLFDELDTAGLLNSLADGAYLTDCQRRIVFWNDAASRITGWPAHEVVGRPCSDGILAHVDKDGHALCGDEHCPLHRSVVTGEASTQPILVFARTRAGQRVPVEVSVGPLRNRAGVVVGGIEVFRDLTQGVEDLWRAKRIQDFALDCPLPEDDRVEIERCYQPHELVGGDFLRVERVGADRYALLMADVMGHGVAAALYSMQLRSLWEDHRAALGSPAQFLGVLNQRLNTLLSDAGYFATAAAVVYDAVTGELRCVRAGHPPPLLFRREGPAVSLGKAQPALGMFADTEYVETVEQMVPGDTLLLFTDGAIEVEDAAGQELGMAGLERLGASLAGSSREAGLRLSELEAALLRFCGRLRLPDDLALLKLQRRR